ncbi:MAG: Smr/MutS family endonuclease [Gammaproteobacteria bacterium]|nr:Smr/MutS family endonuclease [Gammaproteobacteria bacterium]
MNKEDEDKLFSEAMRGVNTLETNKADLKQKPGAIKKRPVNIEKKIEDTLSDEFITECDDFLEFMRPGIQKSYLKQIRNGKVTIEDHLDLHGYRRDDARKTLLDFLDHAQHQSFKLVRIVHGKGHHSDGSQPVLKAMLNKWLQSIPEVLAFVSAIPKDGGTGAVYVLLKKVK